MSTQAFANNAFHARHLCSNCGTAFEQHRQDSRLPSDGRCPATYGWGSIKPFPKCANTRNEAAALAKWDKRIAKFWSGSTTFKPVA